MCSKKIAIVYFILSSFSNTLFANENQIQSLVEKNLVEIHDTALTYTAFLNSCLAEGKTYNQCEDDYNFSINHYFRTL
ncbi:hypothetical protein [Fluviispira multicolorata]|uniref:Uncharacterized protein n=1 Tax=Fluviispira multicolorata TaxID=2654512 RepID=A0A833JFG7_9BACT|nr:hypothetical protein [Fluviispira multicolorata]KAB8033393.1 hypothetical protein GCL57_01450 [Fluviispira multicolorata]